MMLNASRTALPRGDLTHKVLIPFMLYSEHGNVFTFHKQDIPTCY
jgi:hypothetical protein